MSRAKLFQYAVLWHPTEKEIKDGLKSKVLVDPKTVLAIDEKAAGMMAVMEIPADYKTQLDQIDVAVRSF